MLAVLTKEVIVERVLVRFVKIFQKFVSAPKVRQKITDLQRGAAVLCRSIENLNG